MTVVTLVTSFSAKNLSTFVIYYILPVVLIFFSNKKSKETLIIDNMEILIVEYNIDVACLNKVNRDWRQIPYDNTV